MGTAQHVGVCSRPGSEWWAVGVAVLGVTVQLLFGARHPFPLCGFCLELLPPPGLLPLESFKLKCHYYMKSYESPPLPGPSQNLTLPSAPQHVARIPSLKGETMVDRVPALAWDRPGGLLTSSADF